MNFKNKRLDFPCIRSTKFSASAIKVFGKLGSAPEKWWSSISKLGSNEKFRGHDAAGGANNTGLAMYEEITPSVTAAEFIDHFLRSLIRFDQQKLTKRLQGQRAHKITAPDRSTSNPTCTPTSQLLPKGTQETLSFEQRVDINKYNYDIPSEYADQPYIELD
ncbi:MAG: hypothetical protein M1834_002776 [Cirrosporium novae-zelandiae]|nr:MAG: hypothetical protein M1834_002776 [Cirrosporium novae-zelandiae]